MVLKECFTDLKATAESVPACIQNYAPKDVLLAQLEQSREFINTMLDSVKARIEAADESELNPYAQGEENND